MSKCDKIILIIITKKGIMTMKTYITHILDENTTEQIHVLIELCKSNDNINGCVFLEEDMNAINTIPCYFYTKHDNNLIGFLSIFFPDEFSCEIYAYVHPNYRNKGIFNNLYKKALNALYTNDIAYIQIVCEPNSPGENLLISKGYSNFTCECLMKLVTPTISNEHEDYVVISNSDYTFFKLVYNNIILGHCQINYTENTATIFDVEIYEQHQGKGYSKVLINLVIPHIKKSSIVLHVTASNIKALRAYKSCGFEIIEELLYYDISQ